MLAFFKQPIQENGQVYIKNRKTGMEEMLTASETEIGGIKWDSENKIAYIIRRGIYFFYCKKIYPIKKLIPCLSVKKC